MNELEQQILLNQVSIMRNLRIMKTTPPTDCLDINLQKTSDILNPKEQESLQDQTKDALSGGDEE